MSSNDIDLSIALKVIHRLQQEDGDLGAEYWYQISKLLKNAAEYRERALRAEARLREIEGEDDESNDRLRR